MTRHRDRERRPARRRDAKPPRKRLLVVCEGKVTEREYLEGFIRWKRGATCHVVTIGHGQAPRNVVDKAKQEDNQAGRQAKNDGDSTPQFDEVWCVFDRDQHACFADACVMARDNAFELAVSNPCFELWLLLHHRESPGCQDRGKVQRMLRNYAGNKSKHVDFEVYQELYGAARDRARRLREAADSDNDPLRNPTTGFFRLTESIGEQ